MTTSSTGCLSRSCAATGVQSNHDGNGIAAVLTARSGRAVVPAGLIASVVLSTLGNGRDFTCHHR
jgi:hypothetical protein